MPHVDLEARRQSALAITRKKPQPQRRRLPQKGRGKGVKTPSQQCLIPQIQMERQVDFPMQNLVPD